MGKKKLIITISIAAVALLAIGAMIYFAIAWLPANDDSSMGDSNTSKVEPKTVCLDDLLKRGNVAISKEDINELTALHEEITSLEDYEHDKNCLYVLTRFALIISSSSMAREYYDKFEQVDSSERLNSALTVSDYMSQNTIKERLELLETHSQELHQNAASEVEAIGIISNQVDDHRAGFSENE